MHDAQYEEAIWGAGCSHAVETPLLRGDSVICIVIDPTPLAFCRYEFPLDRSPVENLQSLNAPKRGNDVYSTS
jgi:hypothetical protein